MSLNGSHHLSEKAARRVPYASLLLSLTAWVIYSFPHLTAFFEFDRSAILHGETWRIITCHWTHASLDHLFWDTAVFTLVGSYSELYFRKQYIISLIGAAVLIPVSVWLWQPEIIRYRGLSGIDSAIFILMLAQLFPRKLHRGNYCLAAAISLGIIGFFAKTVFELMTGTTVFVDSTSAAMIPLPLVHIVGAVVGILSSAAVFNKISVILPVYFRCMGAGTSHQPIRILKKMF